VAVVAVVVVVVVVVVVGVVGRIPTPRLRGKFVPPRRITNLKLHPLIPLALLPLLSLLLHL
jgi:hypothetical protein